MRNQIYERLRPIFEYQPGSESPPPAPRHTSKPKAPKAKPAVPTWGSAPPPPPPPPVVQEEFENADVAMQEADTPDNLTVASASYMAEDDRYDTSQYSTQKKRKREEMMIQNVTEQQHSMYGDELLDYFLLNRPESDRAAFRPDPPTNFQPDWPIDTDGHTALHWAAAMGDVEVIKQLKRFGANLYAQNTRGETPFMRAVAFTNCFERQTFPQVLKELFGTSRITSLVLQKFQDLAGSYDNEFKEKDAAEKEAQRILFKTQEDLTNLRDSVADLESRLEADEAAAKTAADAAAARQKVLAYVTHQNRIAVQESVEQELLMMVNGNGTNGGGGDQDFDTYDDRLHLAVELQSILREQRAAEAEYVEARGMLGTGEKIDKYRHLLRSCLPPEDQEMLDENLEDMIKMMEDEAEVIGSRPVEPMGITAM
ncbi:hypothetical protein B0T17DRAFT_188256 [Bombardia bombarda]|uniref:Uncharacterized protein n=1 Tax=Bombardia bombarda TaxID=252184 RepID=A0AA39X8Z6_9PEZI|nr:hypothetical protein B0T17DRAFT_188256 [Bombardia bombarda]